MIKGSIANKKKILYNNFTPFEEIDYNNHKENTGKLTK